MFDDSVAADRFAAVDPDALAEATTRAIGTARDLVRRVLTDVPADPLAVLDAYDEAVAALDSAEGIAATLRNVHPDERVRTAATAAETDIAAARTGFALDPALYAVLAGLDLADADPATRHWHARTLREFRHAGVDRDEATRERVRDLRDELQTLGQEFQRIIAADRREVRVPVGALDGLPEDYRRAHPAGGDGLVAVSTDYPDLQPFLAYSRDAAAREALWRAFRGRGNPANAPVLARLLTLRHELATLLGYPNWAQYATEDKMTGGEAVAADFVAKVSAAAMDRSTREYAGLLERKRAEEPAASAVDPWDAAYLEERLKAERYAVDSREVRPYFEFDRVVAGMFDVFERLFGVRMRPLSDVAVWHPEVAAYEVLDGGAVLGRVFLDLHPRADKFSHAAVFPLVNGKTGRRLPECALVCNLPRPGAEPALLQHSDVSTLFHEFGHLLHFVLAGHTRWSGTSGIRTEWDFVEAPSQLLEEWTRDPGSLASFAVHHVTGEPIPADLVARLRAADEFGTGLFVAQQIFYAALSLELHRRDPHGLDPATVERETQQAHSRYPYVEGTHLHLNFGHLVGYSAAYYTYMWSLVIAKDLLTGFDADLLAPGPARRYRDAVLVPGGSAPAAALVRDFLGRDFGFEAFRGWLDRG
jgi:thimet oligopeptidase